MKSLKIALMIAGLFTVGSVMAEDAGLALAKKSGCLSCHSVEKKVLGPAYKDVAAKYKGQADAEAKLVAKVKKGGGGVWGPMAMPANTKISDADAHALVKWILAQ